MTRKYYHTTSLASLMTSPIALSFLLLSSTLSLSHASSILEDLDQETISEIIRGARPTPSGVSVEDLLNTLKAREKKEHKTEEPKHAGARAIPFLSIRADERLKASYKESFRQCYNQIEGRTGCRSSKFSLIHWINKGGEDRMFNFSSWSTFRKEPFAWEKADRDMPSEPAQLLDVSKALYKKFLLDAGVQIEDIRNYYGGDALDS